MEALATVENIIERVAHFLKKDPLQVRLANMVPPEVPRLMIPPLKNNIVVDEIIPLLKEKSQYQQRKEEIFIFNRVSYSTFYFALRNLRLQLILKCADIY